MFTTWTVLPVSFVTRGKDGHQNGSSQFAFSHILVECEEFRSNSNTD